MPTKNLVLTILFTIALAFSVFAQETTLDWKLHDVGKVRQVITNTGGWNAKFDDFFDYPRLINCEYPLNSFEEHITEAGLWIGAIVEGDSLVSVAQGEASSREFFPTDAPWDTIWVVKRGEVVDIPYWHNYVGVSDQDLVCRYNDYGPVSLRVPNHRPLYLDIIQTSYAWSSYPLDEFIVFKYHITATKMNLHGVYLTSWINGNVGDARYDDFGLDDETYFRLDKLMQICVDVPGSADGTAIGAVATKIYPPAAGNKPLKYTFIWYNGRLQGLPYRDGERFEQMSRGEIMLDQASTGDGTKSMISVGPYDIAIGDTLQLAIVLILGQGIEGVLENTTYLDWLISQNFGVPSPPPPPPLQVESRNHQVVLTWAPQPGDVNPEIYQDTLRADKSLHPFEGYRVYKSTRSSTGPWTLLAQFDEADNGFYQDIGLEYEFVDIGLLNNLEYYYTATAFSKPDTVINFPSQESSLNYNARRVVPGPEPPKKVGQVAVVPNPYRGDIAYHSFDPPWEKPGSLRSYWMEQDRRIQFINLPANCEIKVYTLAGDFISNINHNNPSQGYEDWNLTSDVGQAIASGIYLFTVEDLNTGEIQVGKFIVIK